MKKIDLYKQLKMQYPKYIVIMRVGNFYEIYGEEAYIFHNIFNYKISRVNGTIRVGFPLVAYNKIIYKLNAFKISYLVVEGENMIKTKFNRNYYDSYLSKDLSIEERIFKVNERLNVLKDSPKISKVLTEIEKVL